MGHDAELPQLCSFCAYASNNMNVNITAFLDAFA
jgi:hypothetical protein